MTLTREVSFEIAAPSLEALQTLLRDVLQANPQCEKVTPVAGEGVAFTGSAVFFKKPLERYSQSCRLDVSGRLAGPGAASLQLKLTSPPAIVADVFGGYNRFLRKLQDQIKAASARIA